MPILTGRPAVDQSLEEALALLRPAAELYYRLILIVGPGRSGKTTLLRAIGEQTRGLYLNVGQDMSKRLLDGERQQRPVHASTWFADLLAATSGEPLLLDNLEVLFEPSLQLDPLQLLQRNSRSRTVVAAWRGHVQNGYLTYAVPGHPEYRRYPAHDLLLINLSQGAAA